MLVRYMDKVIVVSDKVYNRLLKIKKEEGHKTFNSVILMLLYHYEFEKKYSKKGNKI